MFGEAFVQRWGAAVSAESVVCEKELQAEIVLVYYVCKLCRRIVGNWNVVAVLSQFSLLLLTH
jgi:hypothetical protein